MMTLWMAWIAAGGMQVLGPLDLAGAGMVDGLRHIIPEGLDHVLLVLGLCLQSRDFRSLLLQITLFTVGHSLTLGLATLGHASGPERMVELVVALTIILIGVENAVSKGITAWRLPLVLGIGLVHGLAFAHAMKSGQVAEGGLALHVLGFSVGVELGQLVVVSVAFVLLSPWWQKPFYRRRVVLPASWGIAASGAWMMADQWLR